MHFSSAVLVSLVFGSAACAVGAQTAPTNTPTTPTTATAPSSAQQTQFATLLATAKLSKEGITPKNTGEADYQRALDAATKDIQAQRSAGMGWGAMAHAMGLNWGKLVSESKQNKTAAAQVANAKKDGEARTAQGGGASKGNGSGTGNGSGSGSGNGSGSGSGNGGKGGGGSNGGGGGGSGGAKK